jgi:hypothetical protein
MRNPVLDPQHYNIIFLIEDTRAKRCPMMRHQLVAAQGLHPRSASMPLTCDRSAAANLPKVIHPTRKYGTVQYATIRYPTIYICNINCGISKVDNIKRS